MSTKQHDETEVCDAGFTAADMATAAAQGFRDGQAAELAAMRAGGAPVAWALFTPTGHCRMWTQDKAQAYAASLDTGIAVASLYTHPQPAAQDAELLDWLLWKLPGDSLRYVVGELADTSDAAEFRSAIRAAIAAQGEKT